MRPPQHRVFYLRQRGRNETRFLLGRHVGIVLAALAALFLLQPYAPEPPGGPVVHLRKTPHDVSLRAYAQYSPALAQAQRLEQEVQAIHQSKTLSAAERQTRIAAAARRLDRYRRLGDLELRLAGASLAPAQRDTLRQTVETLRRQLETESPRQD
ncbi:MAG: hypothetical protein OHK0039_32590 [Bacteroidia bacterium]